MNSSSQALSTERSQRITEALEPFVRSGALAGAVALVADNDEVLGLATVGFADLAAQTPMQPQTLFWVASQTKPVTAAALMMLVDEKKVGLDDPVQKYLPFFEAHWVMAEQDEDHLLLKKANRPITVRDILRHTSGLPFRSAMEEPTLDSLTLSDAVRSYAMVPLQFQPGTRYAYSNAGINIAGRLIEIVSAMPYAAFLQDRLFDPLGMTDTTFWPNAEQLGRLAKSYQPNADQTGLEEIQISQLHYPLDDPQRQPMPAGGLFSTAIDMARFCQMILNGGKEGMKVYLSSDSIAEMTKRQTDRSIEESYGLGWSVGAGTFGHGGALSTGMTIHSDLGLITVFLVQHSGFLYDGDKSQAAFVTEAIKDPTAI